MVAPVGKWFTVGHEDVGMERFALLPRVVYVDNAEAVAVVYVDELCVLERNSPAFCLWHPMTVSTGKE